MNLCFSKKDYEIVLLRQQNEQSEHYKFGFENPEFDYNNFEEKFGKAVGGSFPWTDFLCGERDKKTLLAKQKYDEYKIEEFKSKLKILMEEYNINIGFGCGCCDAGIGCKDLDFDLED